MSNEPTERKGNALRSGCGALAILSTGGLFILSLGVQWMKEQSRIEKWESGWDAITYERSSEIRRQEAILKEWKEELPVYKAAISSVKEKKEREEAERQRRLANEGLKVCNLSSYPEVYVAAVYWDPNRGDWVGEGWWNVANGDCDKIRTKIFSDSVYVYAETPGGSIYYGGNSYFCTLSSRFTILKPGEANCNNGEKKRFDRKTVVDGGFTWTLR